MFAQLVQGRVADKAGVGKELERWLDELAPKATGWLGLTAGVTHDHQFVALQRFDSAEAAARSADRPEHATWLQRLESYMAGELSVWDCPTVRQPKEGPCEQAGFVQVLLGRVTDPKRLAGLQPDMERMLREQSAHILAVTVAEVADGRGSFIQSTYATSEQDVLTAERTMSVETAVLLGMVRSYMEGLEFLDLREPWLASPALASR